MEAERDVWQVELIPGLPWVVGVSVAAEPSLLQTPSGASPLEPSGADAGAWWPRVMAALVGAYCLVLGLLLLARAGEVWVMGMAVVGSFVAVGAMFTWLPPSSDEETFWTWGSEPAAVGQCSPSRVTWTGRCE